MDNIVRRPAMLNEKKGVSVVQVLCFMLIFLFLLVFCVQTWLNQACFGVYVKGDSMYSTLYNNDFLYAYRGTSPSRGDIVIISVSEENKQKNSLSGDYLIKRLIATEGDTVRCDHNVLQIKYKGTTDFVTVNEPYAYRQTSDIPERTVGEGEIFFLGDNRLNSHDSRSLQGNFYKTDVVGVVPQWAVDIKAFTTGFDTLKNTVANLFHF